MQLVERDMTPAEFERMTSGFREHARVHGRSDEESRRFGFVVVNDTGFVGCSSGLAQHIGERFLPWFYLTDLFVERAYRGRGVKRLVTP